MDLRPKYHGEVITSNAFVSPCSHPRSVSVDIVLTKDVVMEHALYLDSPQDKSQTNGSMICSNLGVCLLRPVESKVVDPN